MFIENGKIYVAAFQKPWWVSQFMLQSWARGLGIEIAGLWPRGHVNAPEPLIPPNTRPYTHLVAGRMAGPSRELELPTEMAWVQAYELGESQKPFVVRRRRAG